MKTAKEIIDILKSIDDVRINEKTDEFEVMFNPPSTTYPDGWETNDGFNYQSFTQELLLLIEAHLRDE